MNTNLGQFAHGLPNPAADETPYVKELHRALVQMAQRLAKRDDDVIPYTASANKVLLSDVTGTQAGNVKWGTTSGLLGYIVLSPAYASSVTVDLTAYSAYSAVIINITLTGNITFNITNGSDGQVIRVWFTQDGTGSRTFTAGANLRFSADVPSPTLTTTLNKIDTLGFQWRGVDSKAWLLAVVKGF